MILAVTSNILGNFRFPIFDIRFWNAATPRARMTVPKTPIYENRFLLGDVTYVWAAWQVFPMKAVTGQKIPHHLSYHEFRLRIAALDRPHDGRAHRRGFIHAFRAGVTRWSKSW